MLKLFTFPHLDYDTFYVLLYRLHVQNPDIMEIWGMSSLHLC